MSAVSLVGRCFGIALMVGVSGCGGGGGDGSAPSGPSRLFVADSGSSVVRSTANDNPFPGTLVLERTISGPSVSAIMPDLAYDPVNNRLYIVNNSTITVVNAASTATGSPAPSRTISSAAFVSTLLSVALDTTRDVLYVADSINIKVFDGISSADGPTIPSRTLSVSRPVGSAAGPDIIFVDTTRDILYAKGHVGGAGGVNQVILVVDNVSTKNGAITANREITFATATILGIAGNGTSDRLFVADFSSSARIFVFDAASVVSGAATANRTIDMPIFVQKLKMAPGGNRLYGITSNTLGLHIVSDASTANGSVPVTTVTVANAGALSAIAVAP